MQDSNDKEIPLHSSWSNLSSVKHFTLLLSLKAFISRVFISGFLMPLDWSPPSPWTDASGLSVDASGLVPPHQVRMGGDGGDSL